MKPPAIQAVSSSLISRDTVAINYAASDSIAVLAAGIARVALDGINCSVLDTLYNSDVVCFSVALPIKEDDMTCRRLKAAVLPLTSVLKPL